MIKIKHCTYQHDERENNNHRTNDSVDYQDTVHIEYIVNFVYKPRQANCAKVAINRNIIIGLEKVTRNAVRPL